MAQSNIMYSEQTLFAFCQQTPTFSQWTDNCSSLTRHGHLFCQCQWITWSQLSAAKPVKNMKPTRDNMNITWKNGPVKQHVFRTDTLRVLSTTTWSVVNARSDLEHNAKTFAEVYTCKSDETCSLFECQSTPSCSQLTSALLWRVPAIASANVSG